MTYWNGTRWVPDAPAAPAPSRRGRLAGAALEALLITGLIFGLIAGTAMAAKGGNGGGHQQQGAATCAVTGNTVTANGLPTWEVINLMVTSDAQTWGWVLGVTDSGTMTVKVPDRSGPTSYEFVSRTYGRDGRKYETFATCAA